MKQAQTLAEAQSQLFVSIRSFANSLTSTDKESV